MNNNTNNAGHIFIQSRISKNETNNSEDCSKPLIFTDTTDAVYKSSNFANSTNSTTYKNNGQDFNQYFSDILLIPSKAINNGSPLIYSNTDPVPIKSKISSIISYSHSFPNINSNEPYFVPSQVKTFGLQNTPEIFNELSSILVTDTPKICMRIISQILSNFKYEIIDNDNNTENYIVNGLTFVDCELISFKINVWRELSNSRIEIVRHKGNCLSFNNFFVAMKHRLLEELNVFEEEFESESFSCLTFDSLDSLIMDSDMNMNDYSDMDLQQMADDIIHDSYQLETLVVILGSVSLKQKVMEFKPLYAAVKSCLSSTDIAVQKTAQKILS